ncbi:hypothetical protein EXN66_Car020769 [Channa argus]|uniref:Uncharacterized protein n=1 Tax=Channa argus TaxID=215402 RepID=A0A6G1QS84_CHAAH|nr:hypothetical protein EXN66_Car020769 [Channa argus]
MLNYTKWLCKKTYKKKIYHLLSSSYGAKIQGCSNPVHEIQSFLFKDGAHLFLCVCVFV